MSYTSLHHIGAVCVSRIEPLDDRIIRLALSCRIADHKDLFPEAVFQMYEHLALLGTEKRNKDMIQSFLQKNGILLSVSANDGVVTWNASTTNESLKKTLEIIEDMIYNTAFPLSEWKHAQSLMLEENREDRDNAKLIAEIQFINSLYPKGSLSRIDTLDEEKSAIRGLKRTGLMRLREEILRGEWYVSYVGGKENEKILRPLTTRLAKRANGVSRKTETLAECPKQEVYTKITGKTNVEIRIGNILPITQLDDDFLPFILGLSVLGKPGGFSGRLMSTVREKEGLTYGIYASTSHKNPESTGHFNIYTFFTARDLKRGIASTVREVTKIVEHGVTEREMLVFKEIIENQFLISHESNARRLRLYHGALLEGRTEKDLLQRNRQIQMLERGAVNTALRKYIDVDLLTISGAGPVDKHGRGIV